MIRCIRANKTPQHTKPHKNQTKSPTGIQWWLVEEWGQLQIAGGQAPTPQSDI